MNLPPTKAYDGEDFIHGRDYLVGHVTSGDHPIQWGIYTRQASSCWFNCDGHGIDEDELSEFDYYYLLPPTANDIYEPSDDQLAQIEKNLLTKGHRATDAMLERKRQYCQGQGEDGKGCNEEVAIDSSGHTDCYGCFWGWDKE